jgi:hypothetical protein
MIGDTDLAVSKLYGMLPASLEEVATAHRRRQSTVRLSSSSGRTEGQADHATR